MIDSSPFDLIPYEITPEDLSILEKENKIQGDLFNYNGINLLLPEERSDTDSKKKKTKFLLQQKGLLRPDDLFSEENIEEIIERISMKNLDDSKGIQGLVGEYLSIKCLEKTMEYHMRNSHNLRGGFFKAAEDYNINSSRRYTATMHSNFENVFILRNTRSGSEFFDDPKFGLHKLSEIDGLYSIEEISLSNENRRALYVVETKTGDIIRLRPDHVINNIINPLRDMYKGIPVKYVLVGLKEEMYENSLNSIKGYLEDFHKLLVKEEIPFLPTHFPFNSSELNSFIRKVEEKRTGFFVGGKYKYNKETSSLELTMQDGSVVEGTFIPKITV